jgi:hypothetical protein
MKRLLALSNLIAVLAILMIVFYFDVAMFAAKPEGPYGCDDFGYLRQARLFRVNGLIGGLDTALRDSTTTYLLAKAKALDEPVENWEEAVAPHCHHYVAKTDRIILQFPPGTGFLMSLFPEGYQARGAHIATTAAIVLAATIIALASPSFVAQWLSAALASISVLGLRPFGYSLSVPGTTVCMVMLGFFTAWSMYTSRWQSVLQILIGLVLGISINFRIANGFLAAGFIALYGWQFCRRPSIDGMIKPLMFTLALFVGALPVLASNAINAGGPFITTYGRGDTRDLPLLNIGEISAGAKYYLIQNSESGIFLLLALGALTVLIVWHFYRPIIGARALAVIVGVNLVSSSWFFLVHTPRIPYYLFPTAIMAISTVISFFICHQDNKFVSAGPSHSIPVSIRAMACAVLLSVMTGIVRGADFPLLPYFIKPGITFDLDNRAVVWSDFLNGFFYYFADRQAAKILFTSPRVRTKLMTAIAADGIPQMIVTDSQDMRNLVERLNQTGRTQKIASAFGNDVFLVLPRP